MELLRFTLLFTALMAWQSSLALICACTNKPGMMYKLTAVLFGGSALWGGLAITYGNLKGFFRIFYYFGVPGLAMRAMVITELACCKYSWRCADLQKLEEMHAGGASGSTLVECTDANEEALLNATYARYCATDNPQDCETYATSLGGFGRFILKLVGMGALFTDEGATGSLVLMKYEVATHPSFRPPAFSSVRPSVCPSVYHPPTNPSIHPPAHPDRRYSQ